MLEISTPAVVLLRIEELGIGCNGFAHVFFESALIILAGDYIKIKIKKVFVIFGAKKIIRHQNKII
jgi:hypothetical protein